MKIDSASFPVVKLQYNTSEHTLMEDVLQEMSRMLARNIPFVFMAEGGLGDANSDVSDHKKLSLWMKANKALLVQNVKAHIHVVRDGSEMLAAKEFVPTFFKFWGYPMLVAESVEEGCRKAEELLSTTAC